VIHLLDDWPPTRQGASVSNPLPLISLHAIPLLASPEATGSMVESTRDFGKKNVILDDPGRSREKRHCQYPSTPLHRVETPLKTEYKNKCEAIATVEVIQ